MVGLFCLVGGGGVEYVGGVQVEGEGVDVIMVI